MGNLRSFKEWISLKKSTDGSYLCDDLQSFRKDIQDIEDAQHMRGINDGFISAGGKVYTGLEKERFDARQGRFSSNKKGERKSNMTPQQMELSKQSKAYNMDKKKRDAFLKPYQTLIDDRAHENKVDLHNKLASSIGLDGRDPLINRLVEMYSSGPLIDNQIGMLNEVYPDVKVDYNQVLGDYSDGIKRNDSLKDYLLKNLPDMDADIAPEEWYNSVLSRYNSL